MYMSRTETARRYRVSLELAITEARRRLGNVRYYVRVTAPGAAAESVTAHKSWQQSETELLAEIADLERALSKVGVS